MVEDSDLQEPDAGEGDESDGLVADNTPNPNPGWGGPLNLPPPQTFPLNGPIINNVPPAPTATGTTIPPPPPPSLGDTGSPEDDTGVA
jgi:hypothetical protein